MYLLQFEIAKDVKIIHVELADGTRLRRGLCFPAVKSGSWAGVLKIALGCLIEL